MRKYKISELLTIKYGKSQQDVECVNGKYNIYGTSGIIGKSNNFLHNKPSILIGRKGSIENLYYVDTPFWTVDTLFYTIINTNVVLPKYLFYLLSRVNFKQLDEGTTIPSLRIETLNKLVFFIHNTNLQQHIVDTIGSIDDLIDLYSLVNIKIDNYLSYNYEKLDKDDLRLFFDEFETYNGGAFKSNQYVEISKNLLITIKNIKNMGFDYAQRTYISDKTAKKMNQYKLDIGDILMTMTGDIGRMGIISLENCFLNQRVLKIKGSSQVYTYSFLKNNYNYIKTLGHGSVQANIGIKEISSLQIRHSEKQINIFSNFNQLFLDTLVSNNIKISNLYKLKELLLNKYFY